MSEPLKAAVVGSGWGRYHAMAYAQTEGVKLVALAGRTHSEHSLQLAQEFSIPLYTDLSEMLAREKPHMVSVCTREAQHKEVTLTCLEAGAHVCCEKVMAEDSHEARAMVEAASRAKRQLMVSYNYRYSPSFQKLKQLIEQGRFGTPVLANALTFGYCLHHTLDLLTFLLGDVAEVFGLLREDTPEPTAITPEKHGRWYYSGAFHKSVTLRFTNGAAANIASSDYIRIGHPALRVDYVGTRGRATVEDIVGKLTVYEADREAYCWLPSLLLDRLDLPSTTVTCVSQFAQAILDQQPVPIPGEQGLRMLLLEEAIADSIEQGKPFAIKS